MTISVPNRLLHLLVSLPFAAIAFLQLNDPDPLLWVTMYLTVALVPAVKAFGFASPTLTGIALGIAVACLIISYPGFVVYLESGDWMAVGQEMSDRKPYVESAREFLGALIGMLVALTYRK